MRWIAMLCLVFTGCANRVHRIAVGYCNGVPVVSVEFAQVNVKVDEPNRLDCGVECSKVSVSGFQGNVK